MTTATITHIRRASGTDAVCGAEGRIPMTALAYKESNCFQCLNTYGKELQKEGERKATKGHEIQDAAQTRGVWNKEG